MKAQIGQTFSVGGGDEEVSEALSSASLMSVFEDSPILIYEGV